MPINDVINGIKVAAELSGIQSKITGTVRDIRHEMKRFGVDIAPGNQIIESWSEVFNAIDNKTYKDKFKIGDCIQCDFGKEGTVFMQIAAFDKDKLASDEGYAAITWVAKYCLAVKREMKESGYWLPIITNKGGWKESDMRLALSDVKYEIDNTVRSRIALVKKHNIQNDTNDYLWILSVDEYQQYKSNPNISFSYNESFWLRDPKGGSDFYQVYPSGRIVPMFSSNKDGVLVCFCTN